jgi:DNA invertase Pin-like site-specific DNA recombinase
VVSSNDVRVAANGDTQLISSQPPKFERELIPAHAGEAHKRAKARGVHMGRPPKLTAHQKHDALKACAAGTATQADLARLFNVGQSTISRRAA